MISKESKTVLVTGASGMIGPELIRALLARGHRVRALVRQSPLRISGSALEIVHGDLANGTGLSGAVDGVDVVFHLAAKLHLNDPAADLYETYYNINVGGTRRLLEAATAAMVDRFVFFSTINVLGSTDGVAIMNEESAVKPETLYARTKAEAEDIVRDFPGTVILRLAAVYGPEMKGNYPKLLNALKKGLFFQIGDGTNRRTLVHVKDVCEAALLAASAPQAVGALFHVTDGRIHTMSAIIDAICSAIGRPAPRAHVPVSWVRQIAAAIQIGFSIFGKPAPITTALVDKFVEDVAVSGDQIQHKLGFHPRYDLIEGWRNVLLES